MRWLKRAITLQKHFFKHLKINIVSHMRNDMAKFQKSRLNGVAKIRRNHIYIHTYLYKKLNLGTVHKCCQPRGGRFGQPKLTRNDCKERKTRKLSPKSWQGGDCQLSNKKFTWTNCFEKLKIYVRLNFFYLLCPGFPYSRK